MGTDSIGETHMKIAFIGSGHVGQALAELAIKAGHEVTLTNRHGADSLKEIVAGLGPQAKAADLADIADGQDLIVLAVPFNQIKNIDSNLLKGKKVIDASNYFPQRDGQNTDLLTHKIASSQLVANHFRGSEVAKAFNTFGVANLGSLAKAVGAPDRIVMTVAGDGEVKKIATDLISEIGFQPYDAGSLSESFKVQADGPIFGFQGTLDEITKKLA
ncbi:NADPH-dependent F420 reductase [Oenococcus kitaharae]|uniref:NADPH-dependent F420 reductase n=1 Tax=Oenococcus TaxID=46254 RepID=UPI003994E095